MGVHAASDVQVRSTSDRDPKEVTIPASHVIELELVSMPFLTILRATVRDWRRRAVRNATMDLNASAATAVTDAAGNFSVVVASPPGTVMPLSVSVRSLLQYGNTVTVADEPALRISLLWSARRAGAACRRCSPSQPSRRCCC